ncbi:Cytochrome b-c1 complex subunit Rieske, mitochondrial [Clarireedia jacksonii]
MASLIASRAMMRSVPHTISKMGLRALSTTTPVKAGASAAAGSTTHDFNKIPDFSKYKSKKTGVQNMVYSYFMVGAMGALTAAGAKATVQDFLVNMSASADVLAMAKVEVDLNAIPEGKNVIIKWRGKPVFIRHRTEDEIKEAENVKVESLRDPQADADRVKKPEWLVMIGMCFAFYPGSYFNRKNILY